VSIDPATALRPRGDGRAVGDRQSELGFLASWSFFRQGIHESFSVNGTKWHWLATFEKVFIPDLQGPKRFSIRVPNGLEQSPRRRCRRSARASLSGVSPIAESLRGLALPMNSPRWNTRQSANLPQTPSLLIGAPGVGFSAFFVRAGLSSDGDSLDRLTSERRSQGCHQLADASGETTRRREPRGVSGTLIVSPTGSIPRRKNPARQVTNDKVEASRAMLNVGQKAPTCQRPPTRVAVRPA
jgi:hypothetical protein